MPELSVLPVAALSAFAVSCALSYYLSRPDGPLQILDIPNDRSLHRTPVSRSGGLAIWAGGLVGTLVAQLSGGGWELIWIVGPVLLVGAVSLADDRSHVPVAVRLAVHLAAGGLLLAGGHGLQAVQLPGLVFELPAFVAVAVSLLFVVWMTNLYNFMDGMDGFAGGMAVFGFGTLGLLGYLSGDGFYAGVCWAVAAAAGGFLVWNFPPARLFMGDTGASALGFMAAALSLIGAGAGLFPFWIGVLVFSPFIIDATVTLIRRAARGERPWEAHRDHYYQRLVQLGWGHKKTVLAEYLVMGACAATAVALLYASSVMRWVGIAAWLLAYGACLAAVDIHWSRLQGAPKSRVGGSDAA